MVAVAVGYFIGGEVVGRRTLLGALLILVSVITIVTSPKRASQRSKQSALSIAEAE
jgi:drug/metabolite transporter (DMT)-like permease